MSLNGFCHTTWIHANVSRGFEMTPKSRNTYQSIIFKHLYRTEVGRAFLIHFQ